MKFFTALTLLLSMGVAAGNRRNSVGGAERPNSVRRAISAVSKRVKPLVPNTQQAKDFLKGQATHFRKGNNRDVAETYNRHKDKISPILNSEWRKEGLSSDQVKDLRNFRSEMRNVKYPGLSFKKLGSRISDRLGDERLVNNTARQAGKARTVLDEFKTRNGEGKQTLAERDLQEQQVAALQNQGKAGAFLTGKEDFGNTHGPGAVFQALKAEEKKRGANNIPKPVKEEGPKDLRFEALHDLRVTEAAERKHRKDNKMDIPQTKGPYPLQSADPLGARRKAENRPQSVDRDDWTYNAGRMF